MSNIADRPALNICDIQETVDIVEVEEGSGAEAGAGSCCTMSYAGTLHSDGSKFDSANKFRWAEW